VSRPLVVVLGGTRSGKSRFGRDRAIAVSAGGPVVYLATVMPGDPELDERIALHRRDRPSGWTTIEVGLDLAGAIASVQGGATILLDGLTLWVSLLVGDRRPDVMATVDGPVEAVRAAISAHAGPVVVVSDEIGSGLVPLDPLSRAFVDILGIAHQRLVADADEAWLMVAGRAIRLEATAPGATGRHWRRSDRTWRGRPIRPAGAPRSRRRSRRRARSPRVSWRPTRCGSSATPRRAGRVVAGAAGPTRR